MPSILPSAVGTGCVGRSMWHQSRPIRGTIRPASRYRLRHALRLYRRATPPVTAPMTEFVTAYLCSRLWPVRMAPTRAHK